MWTILAVFIACFLVVDAKDTSYGVVIDAGSTGSRVHIFSWPKRQYSGIPKSFSTPVALSGSKDTKDPITTATGRAELGDLISFAKTTITGAKGSVSDTPIFLKATGGMRIMDDASRTMIMSDIRSLLSGSGFKWVTDAQARVISGEEEGVYGWITANYQAGTLLSGHPYSLENTIGAMDLGGASTQITVIPPSPDLLANSYNLQLGRQVQENMYTHSFLYYGIVQGNRRLSQVVLYSKTAANATSGPILPVGTNVDHPCFLQGQSVVYVDALSKNNVTFQGTGNFAECVSYAAILMDKNAVCLTDPAPPGGGMGLEPERSLFGASGDPPINTNTNRTCSVGGVYQPDISSSKFLAFSTFSYLWNFLEMSYNASTPAELAGNATAFCSLTWAEAKKRYYPKEEGYLDYYCINAGFIYALLVDGYGIDTSSRNVAVAPPSQDLGWALGSMFFDANSEQFALLAEKPESQHTIELGLGILAGILAIVSLGSLFFLGRHNGYCGSPPNSSSSRTNPLVSEWDTESP